MNTLMKYFSFVVFLVIINLSLAYIFGIPELPELVFKLNQTLVVIGAFAYGYAGYVIIQESRDMKYRAEQARIKEHRLAQTEQQYQAQIEKLKKETKDSVFLYSAIFLKIRDLMSADAPDTICSAIMDILEKGLNVEKAQLFFRDGGELYIFKHIGMNSEAAGKIRIPIDDSSVIGWCATRGQLVTQESISQNNQLAAIAEAGPVRTSMCVPLDVNGTVLGVINVERFGSRKLSKNDRLLMNTVATLSGVALKNANMVEV